MAALLGMGMNIGLSKMAEATPGLTYKQLANVSQWRMYEDAMNKAQAVLVNFHHYMQMQTHITELEKEPPSIDLQVINSFFGLTHLLGFKFAPRIRDLSDSKLFLIQDKTA